MEPFTTFTGLAAPLDRINVDTDAVIPKVHLKSILRTGFGKHLFSEWRYEEADESRPNSHFVLNYPRYQGAQILLTRENFGCGSSREHALWALMEYGFRSLIGPSFADIFYNNSLNNGLLPAIVSQAGSDALFKEVDANEGCQLTVNLEAQQITSPGGLEIPFDIIAYGKHKLINGLDNIGLTWRHEAEITAFEQRAAEARPWVYGRD
ncbi:MAG: 3-isopropylmalate dehydratase small subunit [SAR324 cluster bacterium]|nr:3-isopropylmalate dehydratase small subunit [SAR324 cluster bacterium]MCZ6558237.1 3-isopropylmalate dehydratase small subunit [SAR324 cluster bacterium]MCZ6627838.1 3-isopropylmalate dehydratase small subunit [SAR324 cluster bacterium]